MREPATQALPRRPREPDQSPRSPRTERFLARSPHPPRLPSLMPEGTFDTAEGLGPYRLLRDAGRTLLGPGLAARRWIAIDERTLSNHVVYALDGCRGRARVRRVLAAAEVVASRAGRHLLPIGSVTLCERRGVCVVAAYTGHNVGLCTVGELLGQRGEGMALSEARRAILQVGSALSAMHECQVSDGALSMNRLLVDRSGSIHLELAGLWAGVVGFSFNPETVRADVRTMMRLAAEMIDPAAVSAAHAIATGKESVPGARWGEFAGWLAEGLDPLGGYATAQEALGRMPGVSPGSSIWAPGAEPRIGVIRGLLDRLRSAVAPR